WSSGSTNPHNTDGDVAFDGKEPDFDAKKPESEVIVYLSTSAQSRKQDDKTKRQDKGKKLEDITYSDDEDNVGAKADFKNLETSITDSLIPTLRVHKDHLMTQIIGDLSSTTQTRSIKKVVKDQGGLSQMFNDDFHTVNTPRCDEDRLKLKELKVFLLPKVEKVRIGVNAVDLQVSAIRHMLLL
nr:hypothetical protein [Tanacetum cinerariifolium]